MLGLFRSILPAALATAAIAACGSGGAPADVGGTAADPNLFPEGLYVPGADIFAAHESGADILFVDARVALDYEFGHIPGARHVPYHDAADYVDSLPKDRWIVTYCECPHAEAEMVANTLLDNGFSLVKVIDDGLQGWRLAGGATVQGTPEPGPGG